MKRLLTILCLFAGITAFGQTKIPAPGGTPDTITHAAYEQFNGGTNITGGGGSLPSQTGNSGKFLGTNGTTASWQSVSGGTGPTNTDGLPEGSTNLYYTTTRARSAYTAGTGISIASGVISATGGGGGTAGGTSTNVQFNTSGAFDGTPNFAYSRANRALILGTDTTQSGRHKLVFRSYDQGVGVDFVFRGTTNGFVLETEGDAASQVIYNFGQHWYYPGQDNTWSLGVDGGFAFKALYTYGTFYPNRSADPAAPSTGCITYAKGNHLYVICSGDSSPTMIH